MREISPNCRHRLARGRLARSGRDWKPSWLLRVVLEIRAHDVASAVGYEQIQMIRVSPYRSYLRTGQRLAGRRRDRKPSWLPHVVLEIRAHDVASAIRHEQI